MKVLRSCESQQWDAKSSPNSAPEGGECMYPCVPLIVFEELASRFTIHLFSYTTAPLVSLAISPYWRYYRKVKANEILFYPGVKESILHFSESS